MIAETRQVSIVISDCKIYFDGIDKAQGHPPGTIFTALVTIKAETQMDIAWGFREKAAEMINSCIEVHYGNPVQATKE